MVFAYQVSLPERFGIVEFNEKNKVVSIEENPKEPKSNYAFPGLYFNDNDGRNCKKYKTISSWRIRNY